MTDLPSYLTNFQRERLFFIKCIFVIYYMKNIKIPRIYAKTHKSLNAIVLSRRIISDNGTE